VGVEAPATMRFTKGAAHAAKVSGSAVVATPAAATTPVEPLRKRKRGFSTLR
jgi:hypothetical protein